jgi:hypothetical protein
MKILLFCNKEEVYALDVTQDTADMIQEAWIERECSFGDHSVVLVDEEE